MRPPAHPTEERSFPVNHTVVEGTRRSIEAVAMSVTENDEPLPASTQGSSSPSAPLADDELEDSDCLPVTPCLDISPPVMESDESRNMHCENFTPSSSAAETSSSWMTRPPARRQRPLILSQARVPPPQTSPGIRSLEPYIPHYDSPIQEHPELLRTPDVIGSETLGDIFHGVFELQRSCSISDQDTTTATDELSSEQSVMENEISRQILIVGSNYARGTRRTCTISSAITLESPTSDKDRLKSSFLARSYSVYSMVNDEFNREDAIERDALERVASFLSTAACQDVRAIIFTGHADDMTGGRPALVPPKCPDQEQAIPADLWEQRIRENAQPGVIVLSIFASCFSGGFMQQDIDLKDLGTETYIVPSTNPGPILVTFCSAAVDQRSYESSIEDKPPYRVADHFLYALDKTARSSGVCDWQCFVAILESHFHQARDMGASFDQRRTPEQWKEESPQTPSYSASNIPDFPTLFPDLTRSNAYNDVD
ncbi:hypothetical protein FRC07_003911 [Ceratobasidium sp. 392]|nr:hypothetical protein FRC07_003911 [Ceratobasidium sp. 392]